MPWDYRPWGCGSGKKGSCNNGWIQFEICQDNKKNEDYFNEVYREACEITAYLCKLYHIDPLGTADCGGVTVPTILCHQDSYKLGLGSNHSDIYDWFPKFGKNMDTVRQDVARLLAEDQKAEEPPTESEPAPVQEKPGQPEPADEEASQDKPVLTPLDEKTIWNTLYSFIYNDFGTAGLMGNLYAESG